MPFATAKEMGAFRDPVKEVQGVFVAPEVLEGTHIFAVLEAAVCFWI